MSCDCGEVETRSPAQRRAVKAALILNAVMFLIGLGAAFYGQSTSILADAVDMAADASGYVLALAAIERAHLRTVAARWTGGVLMLMGVAIIAEAIRRWIMGSEPVGPVMMGYSVVSFCVNLYVLVRLSRVRGEGVHLNASYLCTRADVLANLGVFACGAVVWATGAHWVDLAGGIAIAFLVFSEAREILEEAGGAGESV